MPMFSWLRIVDHLGCSLEGHRLKQHVERVWSRSIRKGWLALGHCGVGKDWLARHAMVLHAIPPRRWAGHPLQALESPILASK